MRPDSSATRAVHYRSGIFYQGDAQKKIAEGSKQALQASGRFKQPIVTEITAAGPFYLAEDYHQDYYKKNANRYQFYKHGCGRVQRLEQVWGKATPPPNTECGCGAWVPSALHRCPPAREAAHYSLSQCFFRHGERVRMRGG